MTATTIAPVSVAQLHAGIGAANRASVECPHEWQARARELLSEKHTPPLAAAIVARVTALQTLLSGSLESPGHYSRHGAVNVLPGLFAAAAVCELDEGGRFDRAAIEALAAMPSEPLCPCCGRRAAA